MGVWGAGLYSGDFALDLRSTVRAVSRLPFDSQKLLEVLCQTEAAAAHERDNEDHTTFWLVVADQFARRGIACDHAREQALAIIESGADIALHEKLGMNPAGLKNRRKMLEEVRQRITAPRPAAKARPALKEPQSLLMQVGDVLVYPTFGGRCRNPYFATKEQDRMGSLAPSWSQDGWSAMVIVDCGRAFEFLAWYRPLTIATAMERKPTLELLRGERLWRLSRAGTCSAVHFKRMELERIDTVEIDGEKLQRCFPGMRPGTVQAVNDISIANGLCVAQYHQAELTTTQDGPANSMRGRRDQTIAGLEQVLAG